MCKRKLSDSPEPKTEAESALPLRQASPSDLEQSDFLTDSSFSTSTTIAGTPLEPASLASEHEASPTLQEVSQSNIKLLDELSTSTASSGCSEPIAPAPPLLYPDLSDSASVSASASVPSDTGADNEEEALRHYAEEKHKLEAFNIWVGRSTELPEELQKHVEYIIRARPLPSSPAAENLHRIQQAASEANKWTGIDSLVDDLLFAVEAKGGERHIFRLTNAYLDRAYLPSTSSIPSNALQQAICDTAICYIKSKSIRAGDAPPPLTAEEEVKVRASFFFPSLMPRSNSGSARSTTMPSRITVTSHFLPANGRVISAPEAMLLLNFAALGTALPSSTICAISISRQVAHHL